MGDYLPPNLIRALSNASIDLEVIVELDLDTGLVTFSQTRYQGVPILKSISSLSHRMQPAYGKTNIASIDIDLIDRSEWGPVVADNYIKNRRVTVKIKPKGSEDTPFLGRVDVRFGADTDVLFGADTAVWRDAEISSPRYYNYFTGVLVDYSTKGEVCTLEIQDDMCITKDKVPEENATNTQTLALQNMNPVAIKKLLVETYGGVPSARIDADAFTEEQAQNFIGWAFDRVLIRPTAIKTLINELDDQTLNFVFGDGDKITTATFTPPPPGGTQKELTKADMKGLPEVLGKMDDNLFNKCVVYYDYDESGNDKEENYDSVVLEGDADSQGSDEWDEVARKVIKSKWIRSFTIEQPTDVTGAVIYNCNVQNGAGSGTLAYDSAATTLTWTAPGDSAGSAVTVDKDGKYQIFSNIETKYIRVMVTVDDLPVGNESDSLAISTLPGSTIAGLLASHWVARYSDPQPEIGFDLDMADGLHNDKLLRVSDVVKVTHESIVSKGKNGWVDERIFLTSVRPDILNKKMRVEGLLTGFKKRYIFIGPASLTVDYDAATAAQREYFFIGDNDNLVGTAGEDGYYIW
jgi:hypothetical protein